MTIVSFWNPRAALVALTILSAACRTAYLPPGTLGHRAPTCGVAPIGRRHGDATATYFACQVDRAVVPQSDAVLRYPALLAGAGVEGIVELQFAVDQHGAIDTTTIVILRSTHELFTRAARQSLQEWRAPPAMRRGAAVRQLTTHGFCFLLLSAATSTVKPTCELEPRYSRPGISWACENGAPSPLSCTDGGCPGPPPPRSRPMSRCP